MKKLLSLIFSLIVLNVYSSPWENHWIKGLQSLNEENFTFAEQELNLAINQIEEKSDYSHPYVYIARGNALLHQKKYAQAILDFNKALASADLLKNDRLKSLMGRMSAYYSLDNNDKGEADCMEIKKISGDPIQMVTFDDKVVIRNLPEDAFFKSITAKTLVAYKMCQNESDIQVIDSDTRVVKK